MPDDRRLFAVTQWVLRAGIIVTMLLIGMFVLGEAATIFALSTSRVPLDKIAKVHDTVPISVTGLFAVLLIFVLAQIFRRGSEMRAELVGTI